MGKTAPKEKLYNKGRFFVLEDERGELFHFREDEIRRGFIGEVKRGVPGIPYRHIEEYARPIYSLTLRNISRRTGIAERTLRWYIKIGKLKGVKKQWRYGSWPRSGWLVDLKDVKEFLARRTIEKYKGRLDWDIDALTKIKGE